MADIKLFVSGLPMQYSPEDVNDLFAPYGELRDVVMLRVKGSHGARSAFVKYGTEEEGENAVKALNNIEFTGQEEKLVVRWAHAKQDRGQAAAARKDNKPAGAAPPRDYPPPHDPRRLMPERGPRQAGIGNALSRGGRGGAPHRRMMSFEVTNDPQRKMDVKVLDKVLMTCGQPVKILISDRRRDGCMGYALMEDEGMVDRVVTDLSDRNIFTNDCFIRFDRSDRQDLEVRFNNDSSWDYTRDLPSSTSILGDDDRRPPARDSRSDRDGYDRRREPPRPHRPCILVNNLTTDVNPETGLQYFNLDSVQQIFGVFGDVMRIKFLPQKDDRKLQALVQFRGNEEAIQAVEKVSGCSLFGANLNIYPSNKEEITVPKENDLVGYCDFSSKDVHRFGATYPREKLVQARPPSNTLYISGLNGKLSNEDLEELYRNDGVVKAEVFKVKPSEARVEFGSIEEAYAALVRTHGTTQLGDMDNGHAIRVAFSNRAVTSAPLQTLSKGRGTR